MAKKRNASAGRLATPPHFKYVSSFNRVVPYFLICRQERGRARKKPQREMPRDCDGTVSVDRWLSYEAADRHVVGAPKET
jgi:hypothetical protein